MEVELLVENKNKAVDVVASQSAVLLAEAQKLGFRQEDIEGSEIAKSLRYSGPSKSTSTLSRRFIFRTTNLGAAVQLFDRLSNLANFEQLSIKFEVQESKELQAKLLTAAVEDARSRAKLLAKAANRQVGIAMALSEEPFADIDVRLGVSASERMPPSFVPPPEVDRFASRLPAALQFSKHIYAKFKLE
jgi:uncharacterized protein YggE